MATTPNLLSIPLEIRRQIYSYLLPHATINIVRDDMDGPLRASLFRICPDIYYEAVSYHHSTNTFVLDLTEPAYAPNRFVNGTKGLLKYIRRIRSLQLVIGDWIPPNEDPCALSEYAREQLDWFLRTLHEANEDQEGSWLRSLVILDHCEISLPNEITKEIVERAEERREILVALLEPFRSRIESKLTVESRTLSQVRGHDHSRGGPIAPAWDTVVGISHMHSGNPSYSEWAKGIPR